MARAVADALEGERRAQYESLEIRDSIAWCRDLLSNLTISRTLGRVAVHPTCSTTHLGLVGALKQIASHLAEEVEVPIGTTCCGTAGDRGLSGGRGLRIEHQLRNPDGDLFIAM